MEPPPTQHPMQRLYGGGGGGTGPTTAAAPDASTAADNERSSGEQREVDCNLASLCDHIQAEGFHNGAFSDVVVTAMGSTFHLHRLILSRSSYFRNMLHGPWKEANASIVVLQVDDKNVNGEAIAMALAYLYGHHPKLNDDNAFRVLAAASFLDLQDLCAICTDFIISELWTTNFLAYQVFAESQDYGIHGERVKNACWGYLCQSGAIELKEVLPKLSSQTLHALLTSDELWIPSEEKRFELALYTFLAKTALCNGELEESSSAEMGSSTHSDSTQNITKNLTESVPNEQLEPDLRCMSLKDDLEESLNTQMQQVSFTDSNLEPMYYINNEQVSSKSLVTYISNSKSSCSYVEMPTGMEGPSEEGPCYQLNNNNWLGSDQNGYMPSEWGRCTVPPLSWGGRIVGRRQVKGYVRDSGLNGDEYDTFVNIFEGGSVLYSNMSFEALLAVRKHLEELGFPFAKQSMTVFGSRSATARSLKFELTIIDLCILGHQLKAMLILAQTKLMLLSQRVQEIGADTCKNCCLVSLACACRQQFVHGVSAPNYYVQEHRNVHQSTNMGHAYVADGAQGEGNGLFRPVRVHVRGANEGLAGIGRGPTYVPATAWPPTRFVFSRVPINMSNRNGQQSVANDDSEIRGERNVDLGGDGLTALVGLSRGVAEQTEIGCESDTRSGLAGPSVSEPGTGGVSAQLESVDHNLGIEWENANSSISLDIGTPLNHFPPFRFGVEFQDVHRVNDGQVKHSPEVFYAGSLWKVSVQAFCDEDPQGRRTLGLFLHRRKAEIPETLRKVHMFVDTREKVTARYQLICPSKREVMVFGSFKQTGTLLPKAPKGWGWRTALLFDELGDLLQDGALRIAAVVQLV